MAKDKQRSSGKRPGDTSGKGGRSGTGQQGRGDDSSRRGDGGPGAQQDQGGDTSQQGAASGRDTREQDDNIESVSAPRSRADSSDSPDAGKT